MNYEILNAQLFLDRFDRSSSGSGQESQQEGWQEAHLVTNASGAFLQLELSDVPAVVITGDEQWRRKDEFHVTLVGFGHQLRQRVKQRDPTLSNKLAWAKIADTLYTAGVDRRFTVHMLEDIREVTMGERKALIQMCEVMGAEAYYQALEQKFEFPLERPPYHATLYTLESGQGIGITTREQLEELSRVIPREKIFGY